MWFLLWTTAQNFGGYCLECQGSNRGLNWTAVFREGGKLNHLACDILCAPLINGANRVKSRLAGVMWACRGALHGRRTTLRDIAAVRGSDLDEALSLRAPDSRWGESTQALTHSCAPSAQGCGGGSARRTTAFPKTTVQ